MPGAHMFMVHDHRSGGSCVNGFQGSFGPVPPGAQGMQGQETAFNPSRCVALWESAPIWKGATAVGETSNPTGGRTATTRSERASP